jgi:DNA polymerase sigma
MVKEIERKLESVRKERQSVIYDLQKIVQGSYKKGFNNQFVITRMYGSMASGLAIEQSDVDLAVVGLDF